MAVRKKKYKNKTFIVMLCPLCYQTFRPHHTRYLALGGGCHCPPPSVHPVNAGLKCCDLKTKTLRPIHKLEFNTQAIR